MKPFHEEPGIAIYCGDCREILPQLVADVMVSDPPYGMAYQSGWCATSTVANDETPAARDAALEIWGGQTSTDLRTVVGRAADRYPRVADLGQGRLAGHGRSFAAMGAIHRGDLRAR